MRIKSLKKVAAEKVVAKSIKCAAKCGAKKSETKSVTFTYHDERGKTICLAGTFNGWDPTAKKMAYKARSGIYTVDVKLAPGVYEYKFVIDGTWCADPENLDAVPNDQGTYNSRITVK